MHWDIDLARGFTVSDGCDPRPLSNKSSAVRPLFKNVGSLREGTCRSIQTRHKGNVLL